MMHVVNLALFGIAVFAIDIGIDQDEEEKQITDDMELFVNNPNEFNYHDEELEGYRYDLTLNNYLYGTEPITYPDLIPDVAVNMPHLWYTDARYDNWMQRLEDWEDNPSLSTAVY